MTARLAQFTTLRLGGPARRIATARTEAELIEAVGTADAEAEPLLLLAGGSNLVIADAGFDGAVVRILTRGVSIEPDGDRALVRVAAGEPWDGLVARAVAERLAGIECLSGVPGSTGATPIQNVGAYGQQVSDTVIAVRAYDRRERRVVELSAADCRFGYRSSALRGSDRHVVLEVAFALPRSALGPPIAYAELARALGVKIGARAPLAAVREAVLSLRRGKGMVVDPSDPDTVSAGSFFVNPILSAAAFARLRAAVAEPPPAWPEPDGRVKTSAAWLIERAGFDRGYGDGAAGISSKHTLALINRGGASTDELVSLARTIRDGVLDTFGVELTPEPILVGVSL
jgi:UDP-N-acetylmuramate dehydrogenase